MVKDELNKLEEAHLAKIKHAVVTAIDIRYRRGAAEHDHDLLEKDEDELERDELAELIDAIVYHFTRYRRRGKSIRVDEI